MSALVPLGPRSRVWLVAAWLAVTTAPDVLAAEFDCLPFQPSATDVPPYQKGTEGEVCEGFYERDISAPFLEVLSLLTVSELPDSARVSLTTLSSTPLATTLHIQPLSIASLYRVDALVDNGTVSWDSSSLRNATGFELADLGFLATAGASPRYGTLLVPLRAPSVVQEATRLFATVRVSQIAEKIEWRVYPTFDRSSRNLEWRRATGAIYQWESFQLEIPTAGAGTSLTLEIKGVADDGTRFRPFRAVIVGDDYQRQER